MASAPVLETNRSTVTGAIAHGSARRSMTEQPAGSILIIGDDELLIRALDRLLRQAGYSVGTQTADIGRGDQPPVGKKVALTIVDLPDHHVVELDRPIEISGEWLKASPFLWIGTNLPSVPSPWFLAKPFSADEFLSRVEMLIATYETRPTAVDQRRPTAE
jgi:hypothetical protein